MTRTPFSKPSPCICYRQGRCMRGDQCRFSHSENTRREPSVEAQPFHALDVLVCEFHTQGTCRFGDKCRFIHPPSLGDHSAQPVAGAWRPIEAARSRLLPPIPPSTAFGSCKFYAQGRCNKGDACPFIHPPGGITTPPLTRKEQLPTIPVPVVNGETNLKTDAPNQNGPPLVSCRFYLQGRCSKGSACPFWHPTKAPSLNDNPGSLSTTMSAQVPDFEPHHRVTSSVLQHNKKADGPITLPIEEENASAVAAIEDEEQTTTRTKFGCQITYGSGASIQEIVTPFESHCVLVHNVPPTTSHAQLIAFAETFGALKNLIIIPPNDEKSRPIARIEYLSTAEAAHAAAELGKIPQLREVTARLDLRAAESGKAVLRSTKAKLTWYSPSLVSWAHYGSIWKAKEEARRLDGLSFNGHTVRASFQTPLWNQRRSFSVELKGLPNDTSPTHLTKFCHASSVTLGKPSFVVEDSVKALRRLLSTYGGLEAFDFAPRPASQTQSAAKLSAFVQFADPSAAEDAVAALHGTRQDFLRGSQIFLELIHSIKYMLPLPQFRVLRAELDALKGELNVCRLRCHDKEADGKDAQRVFVRAYGPDAKALGRLKVELERLFAGEILVYDSEDGQVVWHEHFATAGGTQFLDNIALQTKTYVRCDTRRRMVKLFGDPVARAAAKARILAMMKKLQAQEHVVELDQEAFRHMLHGGFQVLQFAFDETIFFDVVRRQLIIRGDDSKVPAVREAIARQQGEDGGNRYALLNDVSCPVCFCDITDAFTLPCGHSYCRACIQHYLGSLSHSTGGAQIATTCLAETKNPDGSKRACGRGIPLDAIRTLLSPTEEERLLEAAFLTHVHSRPQEFHYCPTADCETIYRASMEDTLLRCPSCLIRICASCHVEFHEGLSCAAFKDNPSGSEAFQRWREQNNIKSCPGCGADLEKSGGCNHMTCVRCGTHMCWVCLQTFKDIDSSEGVYAHMRKKHGGIGI